MPPSSPVACRRKNYETHIFGKETRIREAIRVLDHAELRIGADGTARADLPKAAAAVMALFISSCSRLPSTPRLFGTSTPSR